MGWIFNSIFFLLGVGLLLFLVAGFFAPFESMRWWAGWTDHGLEPERELAQTPELLPDANPNADYYVVYLTGIGGFSGDYLAAREIEFLDRLKQNFGDRLVLISDVFPFAVGNNPLNGERLLKGMWDWVHARQIANNMDVTTFLICARNALQVAVSGDSRYGPLNNFGVAREVAYSLLQHGYPQDSGKRITLIGYSGGGQISVGISRYLHQLFQAPVRIISLGGVMSDDPGFEMVEHLYQVIGGKDFFPKTGEIIFPRRWPIIPHSNWNRFKRSGRVTTINPGDLVYHVGGEDYFSNDGRLPNGQSFMDKTLEIVTDIISGNTQKYMSGQGVSEKVEAK
ncbi:MAG: hypothetical protein D6768_19640 [Chloroflexi bacterium]|nr:MAG: hypothetical protein D6768_19640 [Chloroflexota bacterium]